MTNIGTCILYKINTSAITTLNGGITSSDTTITLTDASSFPSSGYVRIDGEIIKYTGKSGNDLTGCTRGEFGSDADTHSDGSDVYGIKSTSGYDLVLRIYSMNLTGRYSKRMNTISLPKLTDTDEVKTIALDWIRTTYKITLKGYIKPESVSADSPKSELYKLILMHQDLGFCGLIWRNNSDWYANLYTDSKESGLKLESIVFVDSSTDSEGTSASGTKFVDRYAVTLTFVIASQF